MRSCLLFGSVRALFNVHPSSKLDIVVQPVFCLKSGCIGGSRLLRGLK